MKQFLLALKSNLPNIFSLIGITLTIYFSVFYVPEYLQELKLQKIENINNSLILTVQELIYNRNPVEIEELQTLIRGKELKLHVEYPYTLDELLIQTQERFLDNKFIPLDQRKAIFERIDSIRTRIPDKIKPEIQKDVQSTDFISIIASAIGLIAAILGVYSVWAKTKSEKELEIQDRFEETKKEIELKVREGVIAENIILEVLRKIFQRGKINRDPHQIGIDFVVEINEEDLYGIDLILTETGITPLRSINRLSKAAIKNEIPILILANAPLTTNASLKLIKHNEKHPDKKIEIMNIRNLDEIEIKLIEYFNQKGMSK